MTTKTRPENSVIVTNENLIVTVSAEEVAWLFGIDIPTVNQWIHIGALTPCTDKGQDLRFWRQDIADLLELFGV